jgi:DNA-binding NarL/FixJ family response regulator
VSPVTLHGHGPEGAPRTPPGHADVRPIRVLLVDDHRLVLEALSRMLDHEPDIRVVGQAASVAEVQAHAGEAVDVALVDYRLRDGTGADATRRIKTRWPNARVVMLSALEDDATIYESIQAGADGYLTKDRAVVEVVAAVRAARAGAMLLPRDLVMAIARRVADSRDRDREAAPGPHEALTRREFEILRALTDGLSTPEICGRLSITPNTLRTHVQNIMGKLRVHSKLEAVAFALRHGLVEPPRPG